MFHLQPAMGVGFSGSREMALGLGGGEVVIEIPPDFTPEPTYPPGMGRRKQITEEDEVIMAIIIAFLEMKN